MRKITIEQLIETGATGLSVELMRSGPHAGQFEGRVLMPAHQGEACSYAENPNDALAAVKEFHMGFVERKAEQAASRASLPSPKPKRTRKPKADDDGMDMV